MAVLLLSSRRLSVSSLHSLPGVPSGSLCDSWAVPVPRDVYLDFLLFNTYGARDEGIELFSRDG